MRRAGRMRPSVCQTESSDCVVRSGSSAPLARGGRAGLTGKGVIVAIIDTGIDFRNNDFVTFDDAGRPTSRLLYFWDSFSPKYAEAGRGIRPPVIYPNGVPVGTLYRRGDLTSEFRANTRLISTPDGQGHGTSAAGIAAGNGNNSGRKYAGWHLRQT